MSKLAKFMTGNQPVREEKKSEETVEKLYIPDYLGTIKSEAEVTDQHPFYRQTVDYLLEHPFYMDRLLIKNNLTRAALWLICYEARQRAILLKNPPTVDKPKLKESTSRQRGIRFEIIGNVSVDLLAAQYGIYETTMAKSLEFSTGAFLKRGAKLVILSKDIVKVMSEDLKILFLECFDKGAIPVYCLSDIYTIPAEYIRKSW